MMQLQRKSDYLFAFFLLLLVCCALMAVDMGMRKKLGGVSLGQRQEVVRTLQLTDLALFTEARYTRHPSQADRHAPFQDHPLSLDHFPSGALIAPPEHIRRPRTP